MTNNIEEKSERERNFNKEKRNIKNGKEKNIRRIRKKELLNIQYLHRLRDLQNPKNAKIIQKNGGNFIRLMLMRLGAYKNFMNKTLTGPKKENEPIILFATFERLKKLFYVKSLGEVSKTLKWLEERNWIKCQYEKNKRSGVCILGEQKQNIPRRFRTMNGNGKAGKICWFRGQYRLEKGITQ